MLSQIDKCKHDRDSEDGSECDAQFSALSNAVDRHVAGCCVHPGAVIQDDGFPLVEDEVAF